MERKMLNLGRAKKKLRYFQSEKSTSCQLKIKDVFSMKDLDNIFDDLDSAPETPLLSPLPKIPGSDEQNNGSQSPVTKSLLPFIEEFSPLKGSDVLEAEAAVQVDHLNSKGSPLEEIAPIKTSSPIELLAIENVAENAEKSETAPLLFVLEDEDPVMGDLRKSQMNPISESPKDVSDGDSLASPPAQFKIGKPIKPNDPVTSLTPQKVPEAPDPIGKTSASEPKEALQIDGCRGGVSLSPVVLIQKHQPEPPLKEQPNKQVQEVAVEVGVKKSLFQEKLKNSLQPKVSRKQETLKQPARAPSPQVQDEDFMILEDDCPIRFTIPRKTKIKEKPAPESVPVEPHSKESATVKQTNEAENLKDGRKKRKAKRGKDCDTAVLPASQEQEDDVNIDMGGEEPICPFPDTNQETDIRATEPLGEKIPKGKTSKTKQQLRKDAKEVGAKISAEKPAAKTKKTAELASSARTAEEVPVTSVKKKPSQIKSAVKEDVSESIGLSTAKLKKQDEGRRAVKNKKQAKEQEQEAEVENQAEATSPPTEQTEVHSSSSVPVKKASKEPKNSAPKKPPKVTKVKTIKESLKIRELVPESDVSAPSQRKRKPPGEWWLSQNSEDNTQEQHEAAQSSQELKFKRKTQKKAPVSTDSLEHESATTFQEIPNSLVTRKKSQAAKSRSSPAGSWKNAKSAGGRRKPKAGAQEQSDMTPALAVEEEASGQLSPIIGGQLSRRLSVTPGAKRVFNKIYTRDSQSGSAQKCPPQLPGAPDSVPVKRQRKPPQNWWKVPQSQEPVESSPSPRATSPQTSRPPMGPPQTAFHQTPSLQKGCGRQKTKIINTAKSVKRSLATFDDIYDFGKLGPLTERERGARQKGRRNLLHSLEDQSEQSSENIHSDSQQQQQGSSHATFDVCVSDVVSESSAAWRKSNPQAPSGSNKTSDYDIAFKSGPSSRIELERYEEHEDAVTHTLPEKKISAQFTEKKLPSSRIIPQTRATARVLSECDLCGPPLKPIVLDSEDWDNLCIWFAHIWPNTSKNSKSISPDDFHWHSHAGRAMGHMVDLQNNTFSSGKILLGSYMRKPAQMDLDAITVFNVASSCVQVEIDAVKRTYNSGQTFMTPSGESYSIHNMCQEPAVLWYHRMLPNHTAD